MLREKIMKRYRICALARTTGSQIVYTMSDTPGEAYKLAKQMADTGVRGVEILDADTEKLWTLPAFAAQHRL